MSVFGAIGGLIEVGGAVLGEMFAAGDDADRERWLWKAANQFGSTSPAALEKVMAQELEGTAMDGMADDYGNKGSRNAAIQALMNEGLSGGNSLESQLTQANAQRISGQASRQATQNALASAASRGMGGAASTLQAQLLGNSQAADRASMVGLQGAADARRNALMALQQGGMMAAQAEEADTQKDMNIRASRDRIAQFNAMQRAEAARQNNQLAQQRFENELMREERKIQGFDRKAGIYGDRAAKTRRIATGVGKGLGKAVSSLGDGGGGMMGGGGMGFF